LIDAVKLATIHVQWVAPTAGLTRLSGMVSLQAHQVSLIKVDSTMLLAATSNHWAQDVPLSLSCKQ
jgi:hypothetical protein